MPPDKAADLSIERVSSLLVDRIAKRVAEALMQIVPDKQFAGNLLRILKEEVKAHATS